MIAAPPHMKQHSTTVAAIDAAFIRNGALAGPGIFEAVAKGVVAAIDLVAAVGLAE